MSAREELDGFLSAYRAEKRKALIGAHRAEVLREVADLLEQGLVKDPLDEAEEHVNDCYRADIRRLRRMAEEATS